MEKREEEFEACVVGGGVMGSCAAYSLAEAGKSTVLLEQFPIPHTRGSSCGHSRITSLSDYNSPSSATLVHHGYKQWIKIAATAAIPANNLIKAAPLVTVGCDEAIKKKSQRIKNTVNNLTPTLIDIDKFNSKYKTLMPSDRSVVLDPSGLVLKANKCVLAAQKLFQIYGGMIYDGWPVQQIESEGEWVRVVCPLGIIRCKSLVLCPGPWAKHLLTQVGVNLPLRTYKTGIWYYKLKDPDYPRTNFNDISHPGEFYYSTPELEYPGLIKFGIHEGVEIDPDEREKADLTHLKKKVAIYLEKYFPEIEPEPSIEESCLYTMTPDEDFILDYHPQHKNIVYACGFSGRGFQVGPAIGEVLARMVLGQEDIHDMSPFKASRFASSESSISAK